MPMKNPEAYFDTIVNRLRGLLGEGADSLIQLAYDANALDKQVDDYINLVHDGERRDPYVGDMILNAVYAILVGRIPTGTCGICAQEVKTLEPDVHIAAPDATVMPICKDCVNAINDARAEGDLPLL